MTETELEAVVATLAVAQDFVSIVAAEIAAGVDRAVECWMAQVEQALDDTHLTTLGRLQAVQSVLRQYKESNGKGLLTCHCVE
jgi:hypothetical protein